jgi:ankyrin repeat protein
VRVVYKPPSEEELVNASNEDIRTSLCTLIRLGGFKDAFEPLLTLVLEKRPNAQAEILNTVGNDHYTLLHWAAKRGKFAVCPPLHMSEMSLSSTAGQMLLLFAHETFFTQR